MKLPNSYYNKISFFGSLVAGFSFVVVVFLFIITTFYEPSSPYLNILTFMVVPVGIVIGLLMIPLGMFLKIRREKKRGIVETKWKLIDMNKRSTRNAMIVFVVGTFIFFFATAIGSYEAYHYSESNEFCGTLCHNVMGPEYTAYFESNHARVHCVECHVGEGVEHYIDAKMSGMYQVYSVLTNSYPRPIEVPIHLRPAEETCEQCHWPDKFSSNKIINKQSFLSDSLNTMSSIALKMKTSSGVSANGHVSGVHWHINKDIKIEYRADEKRDSIFWVKYTNMKTNESIIYHDENKRTISESEINHFEQRHMDCVDCHNRPAHNYRAPEDFIDDAIIRGDIPKELIFIKQISMQVLKVKLNTRDSANAFIRDSITSFYQKYYPTVFESQKDLIDKSVESIIEESSKNIFPEMNVYNEHYVSHLGHKLSDGCFRCHSGTFVSEDGKNRIRHNCNLCHNILSQGLEGNIITTAINDSLQFRHPVQVDEYKEADNVWTEELCSKCHRELY